MTEFTLVRHGQANSGAKDEDSYDHLSDLGRRQAGWLGEYLQGTDPYDRIISGTLRRQIDTAKGLNRAGLPHHTDRRLNEINYFGLSHSLRDSHGVPFPENQAEFAAHVPQVLEVWQNGEVSDDLESYDAFIARITGVLEDAAQGGGRPLLVSSTGVIATLTALALGLDMARKSKMFLMVGHTSLHKFEMREGELYLTQFGATPHLDVPGRADARTFV